MTKTANAIVKGRFFILLAFLALIVFSVFSAGWVKVQNDITYYLAEDAEARRGLTIMENEFTTYATAKVMVKRVSEQEAADIKTQLQGVENVALVQYDPAADYKDGYALFHLTFSDVTESEISEQAMAEVKTLLASRDITIDTEIGFSLASLLAEQMVSVLIFVVIVVLAVLVFTSSTYVEIPVMIVTFLVAAVINLGTNYLMGTISFVSNSVAIVLQLALSVDYAIIFCNRYKEEHETLEIREAVVKALAASIPEISASSLTTIAGLTAMTFMKFRLGADMGLCLIKAIFCSLLTVFLFMPGMLVWFGKAMDKTKHKRFVPKISFVGRFAYATRYVMPILLAFLVVGAYLTFNRTNYIYSMDMVPAFRQTEYEASKTEINEAFGKSNPVAVLVPSGDYAAEGALLEELAACDEVESATGLANIQALNGYTLGEDLSFREFTELAGVDEKAGQALFAYYAAEKGDHWRATDDLNSYRAPLLDLFLFLHERAEAGDVELSDDQIAMIDSLYDQLSMVRAQLQSDNYSRLVLDLNLPTQSDETFAFLNRIHVIAETYYPEGVVLTGDSVSAKDFKASFASDNKVVGLMSLGLVMLILFFTFKSFGMPLLLILVIQGSIWINFAIAVLRDSPIFFMCYLIVSAIQMGANIDYAIVVSSRYREFRETMDPKESIITTLNLAFPTIITSGLMMVCAGLLIGFQVSQCIIAGMGYYVGTGTSISILLILFALPQLLLLGDKFVAVTTIHTEKLRFLAFLLRNRRRIAAGLLSAAAVLALVAAPLGIRDGEDYEEQTKAQTNGLLEQTAELKGLAEKLDVNRESYASLKYHFAEQLVTDEVGSGLLEEGEAQYEEGLEQYNEGKAQYEEGAEKLADAKAQYNAGAAKLAEGQAEYDANKAKYDAAVSQYEAGKKQLAEGQAKYDAGKAQYDAGKAQYDAAEKQLADGQAQYDAALAQYNDGKAQVAAAEQELAAGQAAYDAGLAQYNDGKARYDTAKAALDAVSGLYNAVMPLYNEYQSAQQRYDEAVAKGDLVAAAVLAGTVTAAKLAFETSLGGYSISGLIAEYQSAQAQLADAQAQLSAAEQELAAGKQKLDDGYAQVAAAKQQLADAEQELAAGKQELDSGYAQLADAKSQLSAAEQELAAGKQELDSGYARLADAEPQLADAKSQLAAGKQQLDQGYAQLGQAGGQIAAGEEQLADAREQLEEGEKRLDEAASELESGRETLKENREKLSNSLAELDAYSSEEAQLAQGVELLMQEEGVKTLAGHSATTAEVLNAAERYFTETLDGAHRQAASARWISLCLLLAAGLALLSVLLWAVLRKPLPSALLASLSALTSLLAFFYWRNRCPQLSRSFPLAALLLLILAALFAELLFRRHREDKAEAAA